MTANVTLTNYLLLKRANTSVSSTYTGLIGEITIDTDLDTVRVHDGTTAGGHILANVTQINDSGNLSPINANVAAANVQIDSLRANITAANVEITSLKANAAAQQIQIDNFAANTGFATLDQLTANINTVNANVGAFQVFSNANAGTQATSINNLNANIGAYQTFANANVSVIQANLGAYQTYANTNSGSLQANLGAYQTYANANAAIQANELNNLSANAGVQATSFNLVNANVTAANSAITTLTANAATQAGLITTVNANVTAANAAIASLQSNAAVQQGVLDVLSGNAVTQTLELQQLTSNAAVQAANLTVLIANAASQQESLTVLVSNAAAQSTAIDSINANLGAYQTYANANAATQATTITTLLSNAVAQAQSLDSLNTNAATQGASIINIDANLGTATTNITALQANAGAQGAAIESINANVGAYQTFANANAAAQAGSLTTLIANAATQAQSLDSLTSNAATQAASINTIDANLGVATTNITALQSNAGSQAAAINNINANVGAYQTLANANAAAQAVSITSLTANAAAQQLQIDSFVTNTGFALVTQLTANVDTINANIGAYQTFANANAAGQTTEINSLRANITAANTLIPNLSAVSGNILPNANVTYSLGSAQFQWKDLWVSNNTIYIGNVPITVSNGNLLVNGNLVTGSGGSSTDDVLRANVGAYQIFANANAATQATSINTFNANLGAYQTFANSNAATQATSINTVNANIGAYQTFANSNAATQSTAIATLQTQVYANANVNTYLSSSIIGSLSTSGNLTVGGNLVVNGNSTIINTTTYTIEDNILQIADGNPADTLDLGFVGHRTVGATLQHTGLVRDASAGNWRLFSNVTAQPGTTVDFTNAVYDDLVVGNISANIVKNGNVWTFGTNGTTRFPDGIILAPAGQNITMQSDQYAQLMWQNANVTVAPDMPVMSNFYVAQNSATLDIVYRDGSSNQQQKSWLWSVDGGMSFPDSTTQYTAFSNAAVATYLANYDGDINFTSSTAIISNVDVITVGAHIQSPAYRFSNNVSIFDGITGTYSNTNVAAYLTTGPNITTANLTTTGNVVQQSAYYETYANVTNSGGNLTCNFVNGATFYATLTANVTVNFSNVVATAGRVTGATLIVDQGATAYSVANIQINGGGVQTIKYAGGTPNTGTASNTDIMSFSLISLDGTNWRVLGQISNYG